MIDPSAAPNTPRPLPRWPGWLMLLPAVLLLLGQLVVPSTRVLIGGFLDGSFRGDREFVGLANYERLASMDSLHFGTPLLLGGLLFVIALIVGAGLGALGGRATGWAATLIRILLGVVLVCYSPVAMLLLSLMENGRPETTPAAHLTVLAIHLPMVVAGSVVIALAAFADGVTSGLRNTLVAAGFGLAAALAWGLQVMEPTLILPQIFDGLPATVTWRGFQTADFATVSAMNTLVLLVLGGLGLGATLLVLLTRTRVELEPAGGEQRSVSVPTILAVVLTGIGLWLVLIMHRDWLISLIAVDPSSVSALGAARVARVIINTWLPTAIATVGQVLVAGLAGAGIGLFQPLGARSRWLLIIFAPWMFTGIVPLMLTYWHDLRLLDLTDLWTSLIPRIWVVGPAVLAFTLLFEAIRHRRQAGGSAGLVRPVIGLVGVITVVLLVVQSQTGAWDFVVGIRPDMHGAHQTMMEMLRTGRPDSYPVASWLAFPIPLLVLLGAAAAVSLVLIGRVRISSGDRDRG